jgi:hypothetical protein
MAEIVGALAGRARARPAVFLSGNFWQFRNAENFRHQRKLSDPEIFFPGRGWAEARRKKLPLGLSQNSYHLRKL